MENVSFMDRLRNSRYYSIICLAAMVVFFGFLANSARGLKQVPIFSAKAFVFFVISAGLAGFIYYRKRERFFLTAFNEVFRQLFSPEKITIYELFGVIGLLFLTGWTTDAFFNGQYLDVATNCLNTFNFLALFVLLHPKGPNCNTKDPVPTKNLVLALSPLRCQEVQAKAEVAALIREIIAQKGLHSFSITNWAPPLRSICHHGQTLENLYLVLSEKALDDLELFQEILQALNACYNFNVKLVPIEKIDIDDWESILELTADTVFRKTSKMAGENDLTFNLSGGSSVVSAAFMLLAVKGDWQVEYFAQESQQLVRLSKKHKAFLA